MIARVRGGATARHLLLALIVAFAAWVRFDGLRWDEGILAHPDERYLSMVTVALRRGTVAPAGDEATRNARIAACIERNGGTGVGGWFDTACSDFNPANAGHPGHAYGQLPLAATRLVAELAASAFDPRFVAYDGIHEVGRALSALADVFTVLLVFLLGRLLWSRAAGLLAAASYASAVLPIQLAHFSTVDSIATLFGTLALLFACRLARFGERGDAIALGAATGLALASKLSLAPLVALVPCAVALSGTAMRPGWGRRVTDALLAFAAAAVVYRIASPYAFAGPSWLDLAPSGAFVEQLREMRRLASGQVDIPPNWQWIGRDAWIAPARDLLLWGLGPALGVAAIVALSTTGVRLLRWTPRERARALPWIWVVGYFAWMGQQWVTPMRYFAPVYPALCVLVGAALVAFVRVDRRRRAARSDAPAGWRAVVVTCIVVASAGWALAFHAVHRTLHPYVDASHWMLRNLEAPVSARIDGSVAPALLNFPASGEFGDPLPPRVAAATIAPVSGTIDRLRLHRIDARSSLGPVRIAARVLDADGRVLGEAVPQSLSAHEGLVLPLDRTVSVEAGSRYQLQLDVTGGVVMLSGARLAHEGAWNDALPVRVAPLAPGIEPGRGAPSGRTAHETRRIDAHGEKWFDAIDLGMAGEDDERKRERVLRALREAEWIVVPNARFRDPVARNPLRFPLSKRFYDGLFDGTLGFARVYAASSMPRLGPLRIADQWLGDDERTVSEVASSAWFPEEAFSVYDHPVVFVFRRNGSPDLARLRELEAMPLASVGEALAAGKPAVAGRIAWSTREADVAPHGLMLTDRPATQRDHVTAGRSERSALPAIVAWYALTVALGWIAWPWLAHLWPALADRGYGTARVAGLVVVAYLAWLLSTLGIPAWSPIGLAMLIGAFAIATFVVHRRVVVQTNWTNVGRRIVGAELLFAALFALGLLLRALAPDLWAPHAGGEKPMDLAYFNSVLNANTFPPPDPWFAGGRLNYYYLGWVVFGVPALLLGTPPAIAYNLACALVIALTGLVAAALAWNVAAARPTARRTVAALFAALATTVFGNLDLPRVLFRSFRGALDGWLSGGAASLARVPADALRWMWSPSRAIAERTGANEISEFPAFSFLFGDLHAHVMALPLQLCVLVAIVALAMSLWNGAARVRTLVAQTVAIGFGTAILFATNAWDFPTYFAIGATVVALVAVRCAKADAGIVFGLRLPAVRRTTVAAVAAIALLGTAHALFAWPFAQSFVTGGAGVHFYHGAWTPLGAWLAVDGLFVVVIGGWAWSLARSSSPSKPTAFMRGIGGLWIALAIGTLLAGWLDGRATLPALPIQILLAGWMLHRLWAHRRDGCRAIAFASASAGFGLCVAVELVVIGNDIGRMNTLFKLSMQSWLLLAVATAIAASELVTTRATGFVHRSTLAAGTLACAVALAYLPFALYGRAQARFDPTPPPTLDGEAFLERATYDHDGTKLALRDDLALIRWLRIHAAPDDVVLEAQLPEYRWGGRIASFTGRPTLLGYRFHQTQQRPLPALGQAIELRRQNVRALYTTTDTQAALDALRNYRVRYVIVGGLERASYAREGLDKFARLAQAGALELAYASGDDRIYRVPISPDTSDVAIPRF